MSQFLPYSKVCMLTAVRWATLTKSNTQESSINSFPTFSSLGPQMINLGEDHFDNSKDSKGQSLSDQPARKPFVYPWHLPCCFHRSLLPLHQCGRGKWAFCRELNLAKRQLLRLLVAGLLAQAICPECHDSPMQPSLETGRASGHTTYHSHSCLPSGCLPAKW